MEMNESPLHSACEATYYLVMRGCIHMQAGARTGAAARAQLSALKSTGGASDTGSPGRPINDFIHDQPGRHNLSYGRGSRVTR